MKKSLLATLPVAAFVAGMAVVPSVFADSPSSIANWGELTTCLTSPEETTCTLGDAGFAVGGGTTIEVVGTKTLNLNGQTITGNGSNGLFNLNNNTNLTIENGNINAGADAVGIRLKGENPDATANSTHLTIAQNVTLTDTMIMLSSGNVKANYGSQVDVYGTLTGNAARWLVQINGNISNDKNAPVINIHDGAVVSGGKTTALYLAGNGITNIDKATVSGPSGIIIKAGELNLNGAQLTATGGYEAANPSDTGAASTGAGIQIESYEPPYQGDITLNIADSTVSSTNGYAMQEYGKADTTQVQALKEINLSGNVTLTSADDKPAFYVDAATVGENANSYELAINGAKVDNTVLTSAEGTFTITDEPAPETPADTTPNPDTADPIALYATIAAVALIGLGATAVMGKKARR